MFLGGLLERESRLYRAYCAEHAVPYVEILPHVVDVATFGGGRDGVVDPYKCDIHATWNGCGWARRSSAIDSRATRPGLDDEAVREMGRFMARPMFRCGRGGGEGGGAVWRFDEPDVYWRVEGVPNPPGKGRAGAVAFTIYEIIMSARFRMTGGVAFDRAMV